MMDSRDGRKKKVLLIGARGFLGSKVLDAVLKCGRYDVRALIRASSNADKVAAKGDVEIVRGDMMDRPSLDVAFQDVDVVINTANGYMQGHPEIDKEGVSNVTDAIKASKVPRYIFCSVLTGDLAKDVEHFYVKYEAEEYMKEQGIPFIALRPGAFLDQQDDYLGDGIERGDSFALSMWNKTVPIGMIYTPDLAQLFADSIELPPDAHGNNIDVGWNRPIPYEEVVSICATKLDRKIRCFALPWFMRVGVIYTIGWFSPFWSEMMKMFNYFETGSYVNKTDLQTKYFGEPPTPEEVISRYVDGVIAKKNDLNTEHQA